MNPDEIIMTKSVENEQEEVWSTLYDQIVGVLQRFGTEDPFGEADFLLVDDNHGHRRHTVEIHRLRMLDPTLVKMLRVLLQELPNWEIVIVVDVPGTESSWPPMGLIVRQGEIVDGLRREHFPVEFRNVIFEGSRPGTGYD